MYMEDVLTDIPCIVKTVENLIHSDGPEVISEKGTELWEGSTCVFHPLAFGGVICLLVRDTGFVEQVEGGESPDRHLLDL